MEASEPDDFMVLSGRSNLVVASKRTQAIFVAHFDEIGMSQTPSGPSFKLGPDYDKVIKKPYPEDGSEGYLLNHLVVTVN